MKREVGLRGYIGEAVVEQWLKKKYPEHEGFEIVSQAIPDNISKKGGGYLDFCVIQNNTALAVYEVKCQNYILNKGSSLNKALLEIWKNPGKVNKIETQDGDSFEVRKPFEAFLVLLVAPNESGIRKIKTNNIAKVILFSDILEDITSSIDEELIINNIRSDLATIFEVLQNPSQGKNVNRAFLEFRNRKRTLK